MKYIPALDGIRAIAILLVLIFHWFPTNHWINTIPNGPVGVTLFFVLSGYLITSILLSQRESQTFAKSFGNFVVRRALRIFPIYYAVLTSLLVLKSYGIQIVSDFYEHPGYYWSYLYNHWLEQSQNWSDMLSPYWSLSVEEQFYIIWPILILGISSRGRLLSVLWITTLLGLVARFILIHQYEGIGVYMITCVDTFAWGGLLAYYIRVGKEEQVRSFAKWLIPLALIGFLITILLMSDLNIGKQLFFRTFTSILSAGLILAALKSGFLSQVLSFRPLREIGKVSYGLYLYHMLIPDLFYQLMNRLHISIHDPFHIYGIIALFSFSFISYQLFEKPIQSLKRYFV
ncbi:acyltransferase family protein [Aquirufa ecclesiirivi]|uniref:acyltransferase family protein n=1 Tax=Aquirufa ecclesiirivi TaxID=2715124 RepID=UPI0014089246|nr:acyltransferase [Aquirufa ecclesiirivi]NHC49454.1 acyltransferase [Aquirufa ecclesiirivi]